MLKFYFHATPNPMKVALLLEELQVPFELIGVDIFKGEQHSREYRQINPNGKVPAVVDEGIGIVDSHAILLYLAQEHQQFIPARKAERVAMLSWLQFVATGLSPFSGQAVHFMHYAPGTNDYAKNRYLREVERHYQVLDDRLGAARYLAGDEYSIADMALWGWGNSAGYIFGDKGLSAYTNVKRVVDQIAARPAAARALALRDRLTFKTELDEETRRALFPQNYVAQT